MKNYRLHFVFPLTTTACIQNLLYTVREDIKEAFSNFLNLFESVVRLKGQQLAPIEGLKANNIAYTNATSIHKGGDQNRMTIYGIRYDDRYIKQDGNKFIYSRKFNFL
jgi:hypothetical protein